MTHGRLDTNLGRDTRNDANELMPQSRSAMSTGIPSNADIVILSKTTSLDSGVSSGDQLESPEIRERNRASPPRRVPDSLPRHRRAELKNARLLPLGVTCGA